jgi:PilZ domain-containing protein
MQGPLQERRKVARRRTLKAGSISFNRAAGIDCRVRNLSPAGACLEVASQVGVPDDFVLVVESDHLQKPCHVIWRTATRLGVEFKAA